MEIAVDVPKTMKTLAIRLQRCTKTATLYICALQVEQFLSQAHAKISSGNKAFPFAMLVRTVLSFFRDISKTFVRSFVRSFRLQLHADLSVYPKFWGR